MSTELRRFLRDLAALYDEEAFDLVRRWWEAEHRGRSESAARLAAALARRLDMIEREARRGAYER